MVALRNTRRIEPSAAASTPFASDVLKGLRSTPKTIPPKYFYDAAGSALFERITELPEYYLTRSELRILEDNAAAMARFIRPGSGLIEFGSGSSLKTRILLRAVPAITAYVPVDISGDMLEREAARLRAEFPQVTVLPVAADFTQAFELPASAAPVAHVGFFPGSTIGNFEPHEAAAFLRHAGRILGRNAVLIVGIDLEKNPDIINAAYNDTAGITEAFNLNLLVRINRELDADFKLESFEHHAFYNRERHRIEMHLASSRRQKVRVLGETIDFRAGETIHTENSYKYTADSFGALARGTGWTPLAVWTDADRNFCVQALALQDK
jgi:dimethylhistidine N-methyltransferase